MKIAPQTLPNVAAARQLLPPTPPATPPRNERAEAAKTNPADVRAMPPVLPALSSETNWRLTQMMQADDVTAEHTGKSPAQAARALIDERPDLADQPFGHVVSMLARGQTVPAAASPPPAEEAADVVPALPQTLEANQAPDEPSSEVSLAALEPDDGLDENSPDLMALVMQTDLAALRETDLTELLHQA